MRWFKYCKFLMVCCLVAVFSGCEEDDDYRGYMLSGRWFGNLGMMVDGQPAIGSDLEFIPQDYGGYTQGYGYETDYYYGWRGRVEIVEHYFTWTVRDGIIYLRFDNRKHSVNHVFSSPTSIINFTSKKPSYDDTRRSGRDNELLQRAQNDL